MARQQTPWFFWLNVVVLFVYVLWFADSVVRKGEWPWIAFFLGIAILANVTEGARQRMGKKAAP